MARRRRQAASGGAIEFAPSRHRAAPPAPAQPVQRPRIVRPPGDRVLILGQAPGRRLAPALDPEATRTGAWLARMCALEPDAFRSTFELGNVLDYYPGTLGSTGDRFPLRAAKEAAAGLDLARYDRVVALGGVAVALGMRGAIEWLAWREHRGTLVGPLPHPSGLNRWYTVRQNLDAARAFMLEVTALAQGA